MRGLCKKEQTPVFPTLSRGTAGASPWPRVELTRGLDSAGESSARCNSKEQALPSLCVCVWKSKLCLTQRESPRRSCVISVSQQSPRRQRHRGPRKPHQCFCRKGNAEIGSGTWARCDWTSYCTWSEPVNWPHISAWNERWALTWAAAQSWVYTEVVLLLGKSLSSQKWVLETYPGHFIAKRRTEQHKRKDSGMAWFQSTSGWRADTVFVRIQNLIQIQTC